MPLRLARFALHLCLCGCCLLACAAWAFEADDELSFSHWMGQDARDNTSINGVNAISKDALGFMWFGGETGLVRFNGHGYETFLKQPDDSTSLSENFVWDLWLDRQKVLWIATENGLNRFNADTENFTRFLHPVSPTSSNQFSSIAEDLEGNLWLGNARGLDRLSPAREKLEPQPELTRIDVRKVLAVDADILWLGTHDRGLARFNTRSRELQWFRHDPSAADSLPNNDVRALTLDGRGNLWVGTFGGGIARLDAATGRFKRYTKDDGKLFRLGSNIVWDMFTDHTGNVWAATEPGGVSRFDPVMDQFVLSDHNPNRKESLGSSKTRSLFSDELGDVWIGLFPHGVDQLSLFAQQFRNYRSQAGEMGLSNPSVLSFLPNEDGDLWIGTEGGLNRLDTSSRRFRHYVADAHNPKALQANAVLALAPGEGRHLWVSAWGAGLYNFDTKSGEFNPVLPAPEKPLGLQSPFNWTMLRDRAGTLWVGGETGGLQQWLGGERFQSFAPDPTNPAAVSHQFLRSLLQTRDGRLWVGTYNGLDEFLPGQQAFKHHLRNAQGGNLYGKAIVALFEDSQQQLWVCSQDSGVTRYNPATGEVYNFSTANGLAANFVSSAIEDDQGYIWVSTSKGLARIDPRSNAIILIDKNNGVVGNNFNRNAAYKNLQGELYFGGAEGLTQFNPALLFEQAAPPPRVVIQNLRLQNTKASIGQADSVLPKALNQLQRVELNHRHSMVALDFYALSYRAPQLNSYAYKLLGFDRDWNYVGNTHTATYTNLPPGDYIFQVKAANSLGIWNETPAQIELHISPAPWASTWAFIAYGLLLIATAVALFRGQQKRLAYKQAQALNTKLQHLDKLKDAFLANTSHELRTPLNGIIGLADALQDGSQGEISSGVRHTLKMISNSGRRLSLLINDILDFAKLSKRSLELNRKSLAIRPAVEAALELAKPLIGEKPLELINLLPMDMPAVSADANRLQQILLNLIGNAIKFTHRGSIQVSGQVLDEHLVISITDTGIGIVPQDCDKLFTEFSQLDNSDTREQGGTGLGLAICKQLVNLHGGQLAVESSVGEGSRFYFSLPLSHREADAPASNDTYNTLLQHPSSVLDAAPGQEEITESKLLMPVDVIGLYTILVVDDDAINRMVLRSILKLHNHKVLEADSGFRALEILDGDNAIDLVILDVMMPGITGYETAMRIRVNYQVHQMPIIFLTAKHFCDDLVRGFVAGGNDFLTKPVAKNELLTRVASHLRLLEMNRRLEINLRNRSAEFLASQCELQVLDNIVASLNRELNPDRLTKMLLNQMLLLFNTASGASLWQLDANANVICSAAVAQDHTTLGKFCFQVGEDFLRHLNQLAQSHLPVYPLKELRTTPLARLYELFDKTDNTLITLISFEDRVLGFIALTHENTPPEVSASIVAALNRIKAHATSVVLKANLMRL